MSLSLLPSNDLIICRLVKAMYDATPGYTYLSNFKSYAADNGIDATANALADSAGFTAQNFKSTLLTNLGLADNADAGAYVDSQIASGASFGAVALASVNALATLTFTAGSALATAQATLNADVTRGLTYSLDASNTTTDLAELRAADDETGKAFVLTALTDSVAGTALGDTITAASGMLTSGDIIDGGEGDDSLTATVAASVTPASLAAVETVNLTVTSTATVDFKNAAGITSLQSTGSTAAATFDNVTSLADVVVRSASNTTDVLFKDTLLAGSDDTVNLTLDGASAVVTVGSESDTDGDYETLNIIASGGSSDLGVGNGLGADAKTVTLTGSADLDLGSTASMAKVTVFNAADYTGDLTAVLANRAAAGATARTIDGGSGDDTIDAGAFTTANHGTLTIRGNAGDDSIDIGSFADTAMVIDGGDGEDTVVSSAAFTSANGARVTNFEILAFDTTGLTQDMDNIAVTTVETAAAILAMTITDAPDDFTVNIKHNMGTSTGVSLKTNTASDSVVVNLGGTAAVTAASINLDVNYESVTINNVGSAANVITAFGNAVPNMTITGSQDLTISSSANVSGVLDMSSMTGDVTVTVTPTASQTILFGAGDDTVTATGVVATGNTQILKLGAGDDSATAGIIVDNSALEVYGEAGDDTISVAAMTGGTNATTAVVDGGAGFDTITLDANAGNSVVVKSTSAAIADVDHINAFTTAVDDFDYNGTVLNDSATTITPVSNATLAGGLAADPDATAFIISTALTGASATSMTAIVADTTVADITAEFATFAAAFSTALGTVTGLDSTLTADETVLINADDGTNSLVMLFTNSTASGNTVAADELTLIAIMDAGDDLVAGDFI